MAGMDKLKNVQREEYIYELKPWKSIHKEIKEPMITGLGNMEIPMSHLAMGFARITEPVCMGSPTHQHPHEGGLLPLLPGVSPILKTSAGVFVLQRIERLGHGDFLGGREY